MAGLNIVCYRRVRTVCLNGVVRKLCFDLYSWCPLFQAKSLYVSSQRRSSGLIWERTSSVCSRKSVREPNADVHAKEYTAPCMEGWNLTVELRVATSQNGRIPIPNTPKSSSPDALKFLNGTRCRGMLEEAACTGSARLNFLTNFMGSKG